MADATSGGKKQVPIYCYQCVSGPDLMKVEVENGVATRIESNWDIRSQHPGRRARLRQGLRGWCRRPIIPIACPRR